MKNIFFLFPEAQWLVSCTIHCEGAFSWLFAGHHVLPQVIKLTRVLVQTQGVIIKVFLDTSSGTVILPLVERNEKIQMLQMDYAFGFTWINFFSMNINHFAFQNPSANRAVCLCVC